MSRHKYDAGGEQPQIAGSVARNTYMPKVDIKTEPSAAPQHFSMAGYNQEGFRGAPAKPDPYGQTSPTEPTKVNDDPRVRIGGGGKTAAHNETEKETEAHPAYEPAYRQKFNIASGLRGD